MADATLIRNVFILEEGSGQIRPVDILVEKGLISSVRSRQPDTETGETTADERGGGSGDGHVGDLTGRFPEDYQAEGPGNGVPANAEVIEGEGRLAVPGLVNAHNHLAMTILRSYSDDLPLWKWLEQKMWPVEERLTEDDVYLASLLGIAEMLHTGTTTVADIYFHMEAAARAVIESGIRAVLSRGLQGISGSQEQGLLEAERLFERYGDHRRIQVMLGPHSPVTCPPDFLEKVVRLSQALGVPLQVHLSETREEVETIKDRYGVSPVQYLERHGLFECGVIAVHCVHLTQEDIELLKKYRVPVIHCPSSNLKLGSGIAPIPQLLESEIIVGLGTDGPASNNDLDMWEEMRLAALIHKGANHDPEVLPAETCFTMATQGSARALGLDGVGELRIGAKADIVLLDISGPHWYPRLNILSNLVYCGKSADVSLVMVDGQVLLRDGKILTFDEQEVAERVQVRAQELGLVP